MTLFNYISVDNAIFFGIAIGITCHLGFVCLSSILHKNYVEAEVQTDAWEDYSTRPSLVLSDNLSQDLSDNLTSLDTLTRISPTSEVGTTTQTVSTVTTILPVPPVNVEAVPNPEYFIHDLKTHEINELFFKQISDNVITDADLTYIVNSFTIEELNQSNINEIILSIISNFN